MSNIDYNARQYYRNYLSKDYEYLLLQLEYGWTIIGFILTDETPDLCKIRKSNTGFLISNRGIEYSSMSEEEFIPECTRLNLEYIKV